jgi:predicted transcriptional regulator
VTETRGRRKPGQLESEIMSVLGESDRPLTPGEVRDVLDPSGELSYSTVVTTLTRLFEKGSASRHREGRAFRYGAPDGSAGLVADRMTRLLSVEADRASVLRRFVGNLDAQDEQLLRDLLSE